ncbi:hypothetical protein lerEdw1_009417 [Lerista edwardsae]|nr:hypothetical protein lerEdw1_009417 [Lerista edwardsae]
MVSSSPAYVSCAGALYSEASRCFGTTNGRAAGASLLRLWAARSFWGSGRGAAASASAMGRKTGLPDRWTHYLPLGKRIPGTRFIAFKVPLKESFEWRLPPNERFSPLDLINQVREQQEELGLIIDLTYTTRYYEPKELPATLQYCKILTVGHEVPSKETIFTFKSAVKKFLMENQHNDKLIGVHCTHGLNRTGYLVCRYLIDVEGMDPNTAIELFNRCRGHMIERKNYIEDLMGLSDRGHFPCQRSSNEEMPRRRRHRNRNSNLIVCYDHNPSACGPQYPPATDLDLPHQRWGHLVRPACEPVLYNPYHYQQQPASEGPNFPRHNPHYQQHPGRYKIDRRPNRKTY